ncbi:MAG: DUF2087 domain-containing protein [Anaerolineae bacterium]
MEEQLHADYLLHCFQAMSDQTRLSLLGALSQGEATLTQLSEQLSMGAQPLTNHLNKLREAGFISVRTGGTPSGASTSAPLLYRLNTTGIARFKRAVQAMDFAPKPVEVSDERWIDALPDSFTTEERDDLRKLTFSGKLKTIPAMQGKGYRQLLIVLRWLVTNFQPETIYTEREVNAILQPIHEDYALLRRYLVDLRYLKRDRAGSRYELAPESYRVVDPETSIMID